MEYDIIEVTDDQDLTIIKSTVKKAANVLSVQLGTLEYLPLFGVDLKYFLDSELVFQNETFKAYLVERLTQHQINVAEIVDAFNTLFTKYTIGTGDLIKGEGLIL